jgi:transposase-like protein
MRVQQRAKRAFTPEFRADAVAMMHRRDCSFGELGEALGVNPNTLRTWYKADEMARKKGKRPGGAAPKAAPAGESDKKRADRLEREVARLQRDNERLQEDRAILKKAAAFFAKESQ